MIQTEIRKCIKNRYFVIGILLIYIFFVCSWQNGIVIDDVNPGAHFMYYLYLVMDMSNAHWLKPILVLFPFVFSYYEEWNSGQYYNVMLRCGRKKYVTAKVIAVMVSSFFIMLIPMLLFFITGVIVNGGCWDVSPMEIGVYEEGGYLASLSRQGYDILLFIIEVLTRCVTMVLYGVVGLAFIPYVKNKYLTVVVPFFLAVGSGYLFYAMAEVTKNPIFNLLHACNLMCYTSPLKQEMWLGGIPFSFGVLFGGILIGVVLFVWKVGRRRKNGGL